MPGMSPTYHASLAVDTDRVERDVEDPRVGLADADYAGVDHALDVDPEPGADLQHFLRGQPLGDGAVGVRDDADVHAGRDQRTQSVDRTRDDARPQIADRELAVEVLVHLLAELGSSSSDAAGRDVRVEVLLPAKLPVGLDVDADGELRSARVVRAVEHVERPP